MFQFKSQDRKRLMSQHECSQVGGILMGGLGFWFCLGLCTLRSKICFTKSISSNVNLRNILTDTLRVMSENIRAPMT